MRVLTNLKSVIIQLSTRKSDNLISGLRLMPTQKLSQKELASLIRNGENEQVEFKLEDEYQTEFAEVLISCANTGLAAYLIVGIEDDPIKVRGVRNVKAVTDKLVNAARQAEPSLLPYVDISPYNIDNQTIVVVALPPNLPDVYHVTGKYLRRRGSQKIPINPEELLRMLYQRGGKHYENYPLSNASLDDIDWQQVDNYLKKRIEKRASLIPDNIDRVELLRKLEVLAPGDVPTVAGILFFGKEPQKFFPAHVIKAARFKDTSTTAFLDHEIISGTIPDMIDRAFLFVERNTRHGARIEGLLRVEEDEYPAEAVREILANACIHRDFVITDSSIRCQIFTNRIEVDSPGGLLPGVTVSSIMTTSRLRNRKLAELLYHIGYIEAQGTGIRRVVNLMQKAGLETPKFMDQSYSLFVTLPGPEYSQAIEQQISSSNPNLSSLPFSEKELEGLNLRQRQFLVMLANSGRLNRQDYQNTFKVSERTAKSDIKVLRDRNLVEMTGGSKNTSYILAKATS